MGKILDAHHMAQGARPSQEPVPTTTAWDPVAPSGDIAARNDAHSAAGSGVDQHADCVPGDD